jgi:hypothetical protein
MAAIIAKVNHHQWRKSLLLIPIRLLGSLGQNDPAAISDDWIALGNMAGLVLNVVGFVWPNHCSLS